IMMMYKFQCFHRGPGNFLHPKSGLYYLFWKMSTEQQVEQQVHLHPHQFLPFPKCESCIHNVQRRAWKWCHGDEKRIPPLEMCFAM
uniref:Uncharacterized protein n=1 Tax=Gopherus agassizii TaxID=38772 RepID=A0A452HFU0_9SAUR